MNEHQKMWDACLIKCWRNDKSLGDVFRMFNAITNKQAYEIEGLYRLPNKKIPWTIGLRAVVGTYAKKLSDRLWAVGPEKDIELLKKLQTTSVGFSDKQYRSRGMKDLANEIAHNRSNKKKIELENTNYRNRNHSTDWNCHQ